jgi:hypothetical protein
VPRLPTSRSARPLLYIVVQDCRPAHHLCVPEIGIGSASRPAPPTPPYVRVRIRRFGGLSGHLVRQGGERRGWKRASARMLRSLQSRAVGLHLSALACRTDRTPCLPHCTFERRVSTQPFGPSASRPAYYALCWLLHCGQVALRRPQSRIRNATQISRGRTDRLRHTPTGFTTSILDGCGNRVRGGIGRIDFLGRPRFTRPTRSDERADEREVPRTHPGTTLRRC